VSTRGVRAMHARLEKKTFTSSSRGIKRYGAGRSTFPITGKVNLFRKASVGERVLLGQVIYH